MSEDPRTAQDADPQTGRSDDPRVDPTPGLQQTGGDDSSPKRNAFGIPDPTADGAER